MNRRNFIKLASFGLFSTTSAVAATLPAPRPLPSGGVRWGVEELDDHTSLQPGEVGVIMGQAGTGKTTLLTNAVKYTVGENGGLCTYFASDDDNVLRRLGRDSVSDHTFVCAKTYTIEELVKKMKKCGQHTNLLVCDTITGYPCDTPMSLSDRLRDIRQVAVDLNVPVLVGVQTNRMPKFNDAYNLDNSDYPVYGWMRPVDLAIVCTKVRVQKNNQLYGNWTPAIQVSVVKNRYGPNNLMFDINLPPTMLEPPPQK
jgi:hypothetical protein